MKSSNVDRDRKIWTALRINQISGFVTVPFEKKIDSFICKRERISSKTFQPLLYGNLQHQLNFKTNEKT